MEKFTRRAAFVGALASTAALAMPAVAALPSVGGAERVIDAHRRAAAAVKEAGAAWSAAFNAADLPEVQVQIGTSAKTGSPIYCRTEEAIHQNLPLHFVEPQRRRRDEKIAELQQLRRARDAAYERLGLLRLEQVEEAASDVEFDAYSNLMNYRPQTIEEMRAKALYLIEVDAADQYDRIGSWHAELLASFAHIEPVSVTA